LVSGEVTEHELLCGRCSELKVWCSKRTAHDTALAPSGRAGARTRSSRLGRFAQRPFEDIEPLSEERVFYGQWHEHSEGLGLAPAGEQNQTELQRARGDDTGRG